MKKAVIVSGGPADTELIKNEVKNAGGDTLVIGCDGGMDALDAAGVVPKVILGDFDSVSDEVLARFQAQAEVIRLPREKDLTDTHAAVKHALSAGAENIVILGGIGGRFDHTMGNVALLSMCADHGAEAVMIDTCNRIRIVKDTIEIKKEAQYGTYVSVLPYGGDATVSLSGFRYPLSEHTLSYADTLGVSNEILADVCRVTVHAGQILFVESKDR